MVWLAEHLNKVQGTGIIYAGTHAATETYANWLRYMGMNAIAYHGGLEPEERRRIEAGLLANSYKCVVSTNALGMGIDKPATSRNCASSAALAIASMLNPSAPAARNGSR